MNYIEMFMKENELQKEQKFKVYVKENVIVDCCFDKDMKLYLAVENDKVYNNELLIELLNGSAEILRYIKLGDTYFSFDIHIEGDIVKHSVLTLCRHRCDEDFDNRLRNNIVFTSLRLTKERAYERMVEVSKLINKAHVKIVKEERDNE